MWFPASLATPRHGGRVGLWGAFISHQLCVSFVKGRNERGQTQSPLVLFPKVISLYFSFKSKQRYLSICSKMTSPPQGGWLPPGINCKFGYLVLDFFSF